MESPEKIRIDKWLWAARLYKTRAIAIEACQAGFVKINGDRVKPARLIRVNEIITARCGDVMKTVKVLSLTDKRVGAAKVPELLQDLTPPEEYAKLQQAAANPPPLLRPRGAGRPTKKDRRALEDFSELL